MTRSDTNWSVQSQRKARSLLLDRCPNGQIISQSLNLPLLFSNTNKLNSENFEKNNCSQSVNYYAPVICIPSSPSAGDSRATAGLKCWDLTSDEFRQCRRDTLGF